uniref:BRO1 domain-containing protein n=4 Tax=Aegilops tauschii subsp. strangulata TaxID=200361 RepID=A0A453S418_AEGTS
MPKYLKRTNALLSRYSLRRPGTWSALCSMFFLGCRPKRGKGFPVDLSEGVLKATCMQALGQAIDIRLGLAIDSPKATLAVKRSLACEMVKCWQQAHESIADIPLLDGWGEKHRLFVKWKHMEAKAAAYYYHVLILDESNTEKSQRAAVAALQSAEESLRESRAVCEAFHSASPCRVDGEHEMVLPLQEREPCK